jgi:hypothetical protein
VGHYGIFNGSRFRAEIAPRVAQFVRTFDPRAELIPVMDTVQRRLVPTPASRAAGEPSFAAFTFAPANDTEPDPYLERLRRDGLARVNGLPEASSPKSVPFRMWAMAANLVIDGVFRVHGRHRATPSPEQTSDAVDAETGKPRAANIS